ncbi:hypothetical protein [Hyphomonas sp.]|jgi:type IV secretory pathway protease TraF|uniref:hypothetical protein n=1 Tax=Hyphomonas sp. TaxID=87 RepID=UPI0025C42666|nr:hypothetical protein [Hyphomonas sp.]
MISQLPIVLTRMRLAIPCPPQTGCVILDAGQVFLLGDHSGGFDGRYLSISERADLIGPWRPLR